MWRSGTQAQGRLSLARAGFLALLVGLLVVSAAAAKVAKFSESIEGTYTTQGVTTGSCWVPNPGGEATRASFRGTGSEHDVFHSVKPVTLTVGQLPRSHIVEAGSFARLRADFTIERRDEAEPPSCAWTAGPSAKPDCGTKRIVYELWVYGRSDEPAFSFQFNRDEAEYHPEDPFHDCSLYGGVWIGGVATAAAAPVSAAKMFDPRVHKIVLHGAAHGSTREPEGSEPETGTYRLAWTLTLTRAGVPVGPKKPVSTPGPGGSCTRRHAPRRKRCSGSSLSPPVRRQSSASASASSAIARSIAGSGRLP